MKTVLWIIGIYFYLVVGYLIGYAYAYKTRQSVWDAPIDSFRTLTYWLLWPLLPFFLLLKKPFEWTGRLISSIMYSINPYISDFILMIYFIIMLLIFMVLNLLVLPISFMRDKAKSKNYKAYSAYSNPYRL